MRLTSAFKPKTKICWLEDAFVQFELDDLGTLTTWEGVGPRNFCCKRFFSNFCCMRCYSNSAKNPIWVHVVSKVLMIFFANFSLCLWHSSTWSLTWSKSLYWWIVTSRSHVFLIICSTSAQLETATVMPFLFDLPSRQTRWTYVCSPIWWMSTGPVSPCFRSVRLMRTS